MLLFPFCEPDVPVLLLFPFCEPDVPVLLLFSFCEPDVPVLLLFPFCEPDVPVLLLFPFCEFELLLSSLTDTLSELAVAVLESYDVPSISVKFCFCILNCDELLVVAFALNLIETEFV